MPVYPGGGSQDPLTVGSVTTASDPSTPGSVSVTPTMPQTLTATFPPGGTKVQKTVIATNAAGVATWTFPTAFVNPPAIAAICEGDGSSVIATQVTANSNTQVTVKVQKSTATVNGLLGLTIQVALGTPGVTNVHLYAAPNPS